MEHLISSPGLVVPTHDLIEQGPQFGLSACKLCENDAQRNYWHTREIVANTAITTTIGLRTRHQHQRKQ
jgi:hypothetical protein